LALVLDRCSSARQWQLFTVHGAGVIGMTSCFVIFLAWFALGRQFGFLKETLVAPVRACRS